MHLTPKERDRLTLFTVAEFARRRRARGRRLNAPEAIALIADEMLERAWDGDPLDEVVAAGAAVLSQDDVMDGVAALVRHIEVDCLFPSGTALVAVDDPIRPERGPADTRPVPGAVMTADAVAPIALNAGRTTTQLEVVNDSDAVVSVSSHYRFDAVNAALRFDRERARGMRLDLPAGTALRWAPGERREVRLVALAGAAAAGDAADASGQPPGPGGPMTGGEPCDG